MSTCKQHEASHIDYTCDLLDDAQIALLEAHLQDCTICRKEIQALKEVLRLTESAEAKISSVTWELDDIEMKVYKRLASESEAGGGSLFSRVRHLLRFGPPVSSERSFTDGLSSIGSTQIWRGALAGGTLVIGLIIATVFFDGNQSATVPVASIELVPASERIERYRSQGIHQSLEDALVMRHLRNDEWETASRLRMLNEQAQGTRYESMANQQLQITPVTFR